MALIFHIELFKIWRICMELQRDDNSLVIKKNEERFKCKLGELTTITVYGKLNILDQMDHLS